MGRREGRKEGRRERGKSEEQKENRFGLVPAGRTTSDADRMSAAKLKMVPPLLETFLSMRRPAAAGRSPKVPSYILLLPMPN